MAVIINLSSTGQQAVYQQGTSYTVTEHGDLQVLSAEGIVIATHNRTGWTSAQAGEIDTTTAEKD